MTTPKEGDPFYLDGFEYGLGQTESAIDGATRAIVQVRNWYRPPAEDPGLEARLKANPSYGLRGKCLEAELVYLEPEALVAAIEQQAADLGKAVPARASWASAAAAEQSRRILDEMNLPAGAWTLPGRLLLRPPTVRRSVIGATSQPEPRDVVLCPVDLGASRAIVLALLDHEIRYHQVEG